MIPGETIHTGAPDTCPKRELKIVAVEVIVFADEAERIKNEIADFIAKYGPYRYEFKEY